jgi:hypothetical protein
MEPDSVAKSQEYHLQPNYKVHKTAEQSCAADEGRAFEFTITGEIVNPNAVTLKDVVIRAICDLTDSPWRVLPNQTLNLDNDVSVASLSLKPESNKPFTIYFKTSDRIDSVVSGQFDWTPSVSVDFNPRRD